jgi:hypothetical protein
MNTDSDLHAGITRDFACDWPFASEGGRSGNLLSE